MLEDVFEVTDRAWRGIGMIPDSGWRLSAKYRDYDAEHRFSVDRHPHRASRPTCRSGEVLQGLIKPHECEAFGTLCTPRNPLGATMVSSEGACAAYYLYRRLDMPTTAGARGGEPRWLRPPTAPAPAAGLRGLDLSRCRCATSPPS